MVNFTRETWSKNTSVFTKDPTDGYDKKLAEAVITNNDYATAEANAKLYGASASIFDALANILAQNGSTYSLPQHLKDEAEKALKAAGWEKANPKDTFQPIFYRKTLSCPDCKKWLWVIRYDSIFYGRKNICAAQDNITISKHELPLDRSLIPPEEIVQHYAELHTGSCPHCYNRYWFVVGAFPQKKIDKDPYRFECSGAKIRFLNETRGAYLCDEKIEESWVVLSQKAVFEDKVVAIDVHMIGPFRGADVLYDNYKREQRFCPFGASAAGQKIWDEASEIIRSITPYAVKKLKKDARRKNAES